VRENIREYFKCEEANKAAGAGDNDAARRNKECDPGREVCEQPLGEGFFERLGLGVRNSKVDPCADNPNPCPMPYDWNMCRQLGQNCGVARPSMPVGEVDPDGPCCETPSPGNPDMFETKSEMKKNPECYLVPDPLMPNPVLEEETQKVSEEEYYALKEHRFDCFNPPPRRSHYDPKDPNSCLNCPCPRDPNCDQG